jgi:hypothetical protein
LPVCFEKMADKGLANASVPPPAGKGTIMLTGLLGQADWAHAGIRGAADVAAAHCNSERR